MPKKPTGFVATCQCGRTVGAMDATRTDNKEAGKLLGGWLSRGCTISPRFAGTWSERIEPCACKTNTSAAQAQEGSAK